MCIYTPNPGVLILSIASRTLRSQCITAPTKNFATEPRRTTETSSLCSVTLCILELVEGLSDVVIGPGICQLENLEEGRDPCARAKMRAVQPRRGVGKRHDLIQGPVLQKPIDEPAMEDVAGAGCIDSVDLEGREADTLIAYDRHRPLSAQGYSKKPLTVLAQGQQRVDWIGDPGKVRRKVGARYEKVHFRDQLLAARDDLVEIDHDRDALLLGPGRGTYCGPIVVTVQVQHLPGADVFASKLRIPKTQFRVSLPEDSPFAAVPVDNNERILVSSTLFHEDGGCVDVL